MFKKKLKEKNTTIDNKKERKKPEKQEYEDLLLEFMIFEDMLDEDNKK